MSDVVNIEQLEVAKTDLGNLWLIFSEWMRPEQFEIYNRAYNLISVILVENDLSHAITNVLIDETLELANKINQVRVILIDALIDLINKMGIILNLDYVDLDTLQPLCDIVETLLITYNIEDHFGLIDILENETYDNKEKFIVIANKLLYKDLDDVLETLIEEISGDTIKGILLGINGAYENYVNPDIALRIKNNKTFLKDTVASEHILNDGMVGAPYSVLMNTFINELSEVLVKDKKQYLKEIMGLCLISSMTNIEIRDGYELLIKDFADSMEEIHYGSQLLSQVIV